MRSRSYTSLEIVKSSSNSALLLAKSDTNGHPSPAGVFLGVSKEEEGTAATDGGCPIHIQTAENIKMLAQVRLRVRSCDDGRTVNIMYVYMYVC